MSTKIYYAWHIEGLRDLKKIHTFARKTLAPKVKEAIRENLRNFMAKLNLSQKELRTEYTRKFVLERDEYLKRSRSPKVEMSFYPSRKGVMLIPFCEGDFHGRCVHAILDGLEGCVSWGYWNNTDKPDDVSYQEWRRRRDDWESLLDEPQIPSFAEAGFSIVLHTSYNPWADQLWPREQYPEVWSDLS